MSMIIERFFEISIKRIYYFRLTAFLVSGFTNGTVVLNVCTIDRESSNITFKGDLTLWKEEDYAIAENLKIKVDKESALLVLSKEQWLLIFNLDNEVTVQQFSFEKRIAGEFWSSSS